MVTQNQKECITNEGEAFNIFKLGEFYGSKTKL